MERQAIRMKQAELTSGIGAGVLGLGLGVLLAAYLRSYAVAIIAVGALLHAWGMWDKHRMERSEAALAPAWWDAALYWVCWAALLGLALFIVIRR